MNFFSLLLPFAYLTVLIGSLATFSSLYRRRQAAKALSLAPWFPPHLQRNVYLSLLELQQNPSQKVPDSILKAALFRRATEDIRRLIILRQQKPALAQLLQRGSVGDELWQRFQIAEKELEEEIKDVAIEANSLGPATGNGQGPNSQWGQLIFQSASECANREMMAKSLKAVETKRAAEKAAWERTKEGVREGFMKELEADTDNKEKEKKDSSVKKAVSSDEEVVVVENGDAEGTTPGGSKKKKGKK